MTSVLHSGFLHSASRWPDRPALSAEGRTLTYAELAARARAVAATVQRHAPADAPPLVAVFADRSATGFVGILGALMAGRAYVPLNPHFPAARTQAMLSRSGARVVIADAAATARFDEVLTGREGLTVVTPESASAPVHADRWPAHRFIGSDQLADGAAWEPADVAAEATAYLLFTSGSTGIPKGVPVTHGNASHFVRSVAARYVITEDDRFSQTFDTTFDLSVFDMFVAWSHGASVHCPSRAELWNPSRFIRDHQLTVWFSVPSLVQLMQRLGALKPAALPTLRWSLFCGERLLVETAAAWADAASNSIVENLYGPTELTVACTTYRWSPRTSPGEAELGVVPIGYPLPGMHALVVDETLTEVQPGEAGELLMTGPQRTTGYWLDPQGTAAAHVRVPGHDGLFYRTGDRVRRPVAGAPLTFLGRVDQQIKVRGYRVELGEVESSLLEVPGVESAAAIGVATNGTGSHVIAAFVTGSGIEPEAVRRDLQAKLQEYAIPQWITVLPGLPLNANGKVDRSCLRAMLEH